MDKYLNKFYDIIDKIGKHNVMLVIFIFFVTLVTGLYSTLSFSSYEGVEIIDGLETYKFILNPEDSTSIKVAANSSKKLDITISNDGKTNFKYGVYYSSYDSLDNVIVSYDPYNGISASGIMTSDGEYSVVVYVENNTNIDVEIEFGVSFGFEDGGDLVLKDGQHWIEEMFLVNEPNLDTGLIPVYYDDNEGVWKKADSNNKNGIWYNYNENKWANAVLISDSGKREKYVKVDAGTIVNGDDITAFYVWIPRFKYRVWNIARQLYETNKYSYNVYNGIDIKFEEGVESTGNIECSYNLGTVDSIDDLSDTCIYNGTDIIKHDSINAKYSDAWYTHPAFTFGDKELTGFWMGKFEITGSDSVPTILPDNTPIIDKNISEMFTISKIFQNYGLSEKMDAHSITNLEWGAVSYLAYSDYGVCKFNICKGVYLNNSSNPFTGRSGGAGNGDASMLLKNFYLDDKLGTGYVNKNGYYTYDGYLIGNDGKISEKRDVSKIASTTNNITGVYDMSGGGLDFVMANGSGSEGEFRVGEASDFWNETTTLDKKYYNSYSNVSCKNCFGMSRLGDAIGEVMYTNGNSWEKYLFNNSNELNSIYFDDINSWLSRGGSGSNGGIFGYYSVSGINSNNGVGRSVLS